MKITVPVLVVVLAITAHSQTAAERLTELSGDLILVRMINSSRLSGGLLARGSEVARKIFAQSGVRTEWLDCTPVEDSAEIDPRCDSTFGPSDVTVRVLAKRQSKRYGLNRAALGAAVVPPDAFGALANVFAHRVEQINRRTGADAVIVTGHILAHEVGHLLLHQPGHSNSGLMQASWDISQLKAANQRSLRFSETEAQRLGLNVELRLNGRRRPTP